MRVFILKKKLDLKKKFTLIFKLVANDAVPAFPGATKSFVSSLLSLIFHASACSLPPEPKTNTFIVTFFDLKCKNK